MAAEQKLLLETSTGLDVLSEIAREDLPDGRTIIWFTSTINNIAQLNAITLPSDPNYSQAQMEYDIEEARWRFAYSAGGTVSVRGIADTLITPVEGGPSLIIGGPRFLPPTG